MTLPDESLELIYPQNLFYIIWILYKTTCITNQKNTNNVFVCKGKYNNF